MGTPTSFSKNVWKRKVANYTKEKNRQDLIDMATKYKKIDHNKWNEEEFERKKFFHRLDLDGTRMMMKIEGGMVNTIRGNFKELYRRKNQPITCQFCVDPREESVTEIETENPLDTQLHVIEECAAFDDLHIKYDLKSDIGLVKFFKEVVKRRIQDEEG